MLSLLGGFFFPLSRNLSWIPLNYSEVLTDYVETVVQRHLRLRADLAFVHSRVPLLRRLYLQCPVLGFIRMNHLESQIRGVHVNPGAQYVHVPFAHPGHLKTNNGTRHISTFCLSATCSYDKPKPMSFCEWKKKGKTSLRKVLEIRRLTSALPVGHADLVPFSPDCRRCNFWLLFCYRPIFFGSSGYTSATRYKRIFIHVVRLVHFLLRDAFVVGRIERFRLRCFIETFHWT